MTNGLDPDEMTPILTSLDIGIPQTIAILLDVDQLTVFTIHVRVVDTWSDQSMIDSLVYRRAQLNQFSGWLYSN
ncbi:MAG: hypothetical protein Ta2E_12210 [Mycoplasmoidaceae bacterium]|nr:MAG: hypothetical protein Ta2E_12210 [Mycoplasmoidaceae bacterium]